MSERKAYEPSKDAVDALADRLFARSTGVAFSEVWQSAHLELTQREARGRRVWDPVEVQALRPGARRWRRTR